MGYDRLIYTKASVATSGFLVFWFYPFVGFVAFAVWRLGFLNRQGGKDAKF